VERDTFDVINRMLRAAALLRAGEQVHGCEQWVAQFIEDQAAQLISGNGELDACDQSGAAAIALEIATSYLRKVDGA
jgi:hypothetical protein